MKNIFLTLTTLLLSFNTFAASSTQFNCYNAPVANWKTYFCATGEISSDGGTIQNLEFGTCEGSQNSEEHEPADIFDFAVVNHNPALAAKSKEWKNVGAFDVSTELGQAVLYYAPGSPVARLKIGSQDLRLDCR